MEKKILEQVKKSIDNAIAKELIGYNKPLSSLVNQVIAAHEEELFKLIDHEFSALLTSEGFKEALQVALNKKLASVLISRMGGELEKQVNVLKQNPQTRAKITLAIDKLISEI